MILDTLAAVGAKLLAQRRVERDLVDRRRQLVRKLGRVDRVERAIFELQINQ